MKILKTILPALVLLMTSSCVQVTTFKSDGEKVKTTTHRFAPVRGVGGASSEGPAHIGPR